jgi:hypothetical protein
VGKRDGPPPNSAGVVTGQWIALDVYFFAKPFPLRLQERFGPAGLVVFIAFLCACKKNQPQGQITFSSEHEALHQMRLEGWQLVDGSGDKWTLEEFFAFTGKHKQTRKNAKGHVITLISTHFWRWQRQAQRDMAAERQRRSRAKNGRDNERDHPRDSQRDATVTDIDIDIDIPPTPSRRFASNGNTQPPDPPRPPVPEWQPDPEPTGTIDRAAVDALRTQHGWTKPEATDG